MPESNRNRIVAFSFLLLLGPGSLLSSGCGSSKEDMLMRAARRSRPKDASEATEEKKDLAAQRKGNPSSAGKTQKNKVAALVPDREKPENDGEAVKIASEQKTLEALKPIEERKPEGVMGRTSARARAAENIDKIAKALILYHRDKGLFPRSYSMNSNKFKTLSWRVELLPYLGYEELYEKFDWNVPWNREPNKELLKYIPDEYVSPERFDTNTNYLLPAHRLFMFSGNKRRAQHNLEDGAENTIMLLEVDDALAVPWTSPGDYVPKSTQRFDGELGGLRKDGTFAAWANGWTVLLANELTDKQVLDALTYETGDGQLAGAIHRDIPVGKVSDASVASAVKLVEKKRRDKTSTEKAATGPGMIPIPVAAARVRQPVPKAVEITGAKNKLRKLFATKIGDAKTDEDKSKLATEMLKYAAEMENDKPGVYALQGAAMSLAVEAGDPDTLIEAIDRRVGMFEVDAYEENASGLAAFAKEAIGRERDSVQSTELLRRATRVIYAGIADNDFIRAAAITRMAYRFNGQERDENLPKLLNRLSTLLGTSKLEYEKAMKHLEAYRIDPSNVEAAAAFGQFLCFIKGDWTNGLPLLTKGGPEVLREIAVVDMTGADDNINRIGLGDTWWDLGERARGGVYRQAARDRAVHWYRQAYDSLPDSLDRMHVKSRLDEADAMDGTSPIALCIQVAKELDVDLTVGLAGISDVGQKRPGSGNSEGRLGDDED